MDPLHHDESCETDAVWTLLDAAHPPKAGPRFVERTVRAARLLEAPLPWWRRLIANPAGIAGGLAAAAAVALAVLALSPVPSSVQPQVGADPARSEGFAALQDAAETEALMAAVEQLDDFDDHELVHLIGL